MKLLTVLLVFLTSSGAFACPTFSGNYVCVHDSEKIGLNFRTETSNGQKTYFINNVELIANALPQKKIEPDGREVVYTSQCLENHLEIQMQTALSSGFCRSSTTQIDSKSYFIQTENGIDQIEIMLLKCPGQPDFKIHKQYSCTPSRGAM